MRQLKTLTHQPSIPSFADLGLLPHLTSYLNTQQIFTPTPVQQMVIPLALQKHSFMFSSQNGTGKTLAYLLPIFQNLKLEELNSKKILTSNIAPQAIIILPIRELVYQVEEVAKLLSHIVPLKVRSLGKGKSYSEEKSMLNDGVDMLITTYDMMRSYRKQRLIQMKNTKYTVIDEVDTSTDMDKGNDILSLFDKFHGNCKFIMSSATITESIEKIIKKLQIIDPKFALHREKHTQLNLSNIEHKFIKLKEFDKLKQFQSVYDECRKYNLRKHSSTIVFCSTVSSATHLYSKLQDEYQNSVGLFHSKLRPSQRQTNFELFKNMKTNCLVATDLASRGLDFPHTSHIINFDFPKTTSDYLHRAGRAGRAGRKGFAYSLYRNSDEHLISILTKCFNADNPIPVMHSSFSEAKHKSK